MFTTKEKIDLSNLLVVKKSRKKVRYQRCKLYSGIYNAAREGKHADRGAMAELTEQITDQVEAAILRQGQKVISSQKIGELVMDILSRQYPELFLTYFAYFQGDRGKRFVRQLLKGI
ncbi:ATP cone domain-containing protein [Patescibacteria group bacterium]|nr:ATP cone domain-containing protein [Patescibacteria group bacterium]